MTQAFSGFPKQTITFLAGLHAHNAKPWFEAHRDDYQAFYLAPAVAFVEALAPKLRKLDRDVQAEARVNGSIMRINRDTRFSKDKSPYKDHLDLWFWTGAEKGWESSGFWFRLTPKSLMLGAGMHGFSPEMLARYRKAVLDPKRGAALAAAVKKVRANGCEVGGEHYKRVPKGADADHARAALLKHNGLYAGRDMKHPAALHGATFVDFVAKQFAAAAPIHAWLTAL